MHGDRVLSSLNQCEGLLKTQWMVTDGPETRILNFFLTTVLYPAVLCYFHPLVLVSGRGRSPKPLRSYLEPSLPL